MNVQLFFVLSISLVICNAATSQELANSISQRVRAECLMPPDSGTCDLWQLEKFYYDAAEKQCKSFIFGGCDGNSNHFYNAEKCLKYCQKSPEEVCRQPKVKGPCRAIYLAYHYDAAQEKCVKFTYGGCKGNDNNFVTAKNCEDFCTGVQAI